ncbi:MAG TPA: energy transducer TonB [Candidatus Saccharimonadales bacterium]|nr:energy transducer TonB [Candidatus Saccharimonadales bacterium]
MVPDPIINLLPPDVTRRSASAEGQKPVPAFAVPNFATPRRVVTDGFWSNLKQFLTERPIKITGAVRSPLMPTEYGGGFGENLKEFFASKPGPKGPIDSKLVVAWGAGFGGFGDRLKELFFPQKQAPLMVTSKPIKVKDIWSKDENFGWTQVISISLHAALIALLVIPLFTKILPASTEAKNKVDITPIDLSPYVSKLPAGAQKAGGGGGGGDRSVEPPTKGKAPKFKWDQFTPPEAKIKNPNPKLPMDPSLLGPPDLKVQNPALNNMGDPMAAAVNLSGGSGGGGGIGTGEMGGVGSGSGGGLGPGEGGGTGGGAFRAGVNGVGVPVCLYCPYPQYSDEARKAKYQGTVVLLVTITPDGRAIDIQVVKGPGLGLEEKAIEAVKGWKFKPAAGPSGKIVAVRVPIEVTFRLF